jgi:hypothetical protein
MLAQEHGVTHIQIFGDSLLVIKWMRQESTLINFTLQPLFLDVWSLQSTFTHISYAHIYRDRNGTGDGLSKAGLELDRGVYKVLEDQQGQKTKYIHDPWL